MNQPNPSAPPPNLGSPGLALGLSAVGVCCFPLGLVGALLGFQAMSKAKQAGQPSSPMAIIAIVLAGLALIVNGAAVVYSVKQSAARDEKAAGLRANLKGKLEGDSLAKEVACDAAHEYLLGVKKKLVEGVTCPGPFAPGPVSKLEEVAVAEAGSTTQMTFCFAKAHRWYVLSTPADGLCPEAAPAAPSGKAGNDEELLAEENGLRKAEIQRRAKGLVERFGKQLEAARVAVEMEHEAKKCPAWKKPVKAAYVDYDLIPGVESPQQTWELLTHKEVARALDRKSSLESRAEAVDEVLAKGPYLVVIHGDESKEQPVATGSSFIGGDFLGWMTVVELKSGEVVCDTELEFYSSDSVGGGVRLKYMPKKSTKDMVEDDFEKVFETAATRAAKAMSGGQLKLGLKILE